MFVVKDKSFDFHGAKFTIKVLTSETNDSYTVLDIFHPPNLGPALHKHPKGSETFYIVEGNYDYEVFVNKEKIADGKIKHHNRISGWQGLISCLAKKVYKGDDV